MKRAGFTPFFILVSKSIKNTGPIKKLNRIPNKTPYNNIVAKLKFYFVSLVNIQII